MPLYSLPTHTNVTIDVIQEGRIVNWDHNSFSRTFTGFLNGADQVMSGGGQNNALAADNQIDAEARRTINLVRRGAMDMLTEIDHRNNSQGGTWQNLAATAGFLYLPKYYKPTIIHIMDDFTKDLEKIMQLWINANKEQTRSFFAIKHLCTFCKGATIELKKMYTAIQQDITG